MKTVIVIALLGILATLAGAGLFMLRRRDAPQESQQGEPDRRMARALAWRIGLSIALFLLVMLGWWMGWISPRGLPTGG